VNTSEMNLSDRWWEALTHKAHQKREMHKQQGAASCMWPGNLTDPPWRASGQTCHPWWTMKEHISRK